MKKALILTGLLALLIYFPARAINLESGQLDLQLQSLKSSSGDFIKSFAQEEKKGDEFSSTATSDKGVYNYEYKSPKRAFIYSLIIPGWGQKYAGSHIAKPIFFVLAEASAWGFQFKYRKDGNNQTDVFQAFASQYWHEWDSTTTTGQSYRNWILDTLLETYDDTGFTHQLPNSRTQQYYEMIGKYDQFRGGWEDYWTNRAKFDSTDKYVSPRRTQYLTMRQKANDLLNKADRFVLLSMLNHLFSAFDAAISASRHNRNQSGDNWMSIRAEMKKYSATEEIPIIRLSCKF